MQHPDEIKSRTLEFCIKPSPESGYEIIIIKGRNPNRHRSCHRIDLGGVLELLAVETVNFYGGEDLERRIEADPDVAGLCCPECEDTRAE
jgi:hypothetical protein